MVKSVSTFAAAQSISVLFCDSIVTTRPHTLILLPVLRRSLAENHARCFPVNGCMLLIEPERSLATLEGEDCKEAQVSSASAKSRSGEARLPQTDITDCNRHESHDEMIVLLERAECLDPRTSASRAHFLRPFPRALAVLPTTSRTPALSRTSRKEGSRFWDGERL